MCNANDERRKGENKNTRFSMAVYINEAACGEHVFVRANRMRKTRRREEIREDERGFGGVHKAGRTVCTARKQQLTRRVTSRFAWVGVPTPDVARYPTRPGNAPFYYAAPLHPLCASLFSFSLLSSSSALTLLSFSFHFRFLLDESLFSPLFFFSFILLIFPRFISLFFPFLSFILSIYRRIFFRFFFIFFRVSKLFFLIVARTIGGLHLSRGYFILASFSLSFLPVFPGSFHLTTPPPASLSLSLSCVCIFLPRSSSLSFYARSRYVPARGSPTLRHFSFNRFTLPSPCAASVTSCPRFIPASGAAAGFWNSPWQGHQNQITPSRGCCTHRLASGEFIASMRSSTLLPRATNPSLLLSVFSRSDFYSLVLFYLGYLAFQLKFHDE